MLVAKNPLFFANSFIFEKINKYIKNFYFQRIKEKKWESGQKALKPLILLTFLWPNPEKKSGHDRGHDTFRNFTNRDNPNKSGQKPIFKNKSGHRFHAKIKEKKSASRPHALPQTHSSNVSNT